MSILHIPFLSDNLFYTFVFSLTMSKAIAEVCERLGCDPALLKNATVLSNGPEGVHIQMSLSPDDGVDIKVERSPSRSSSRSRSARRSRSRRQRRREGRAEERMEVKEYKKVKKTKDKSRLPRGERGIGSQE